MSGEVAAACESRSDAIRSAAHLPSCENASQKGVCLFLGLVLVPRLENHICLWIRRLQTDGSKRESNPGNVIRQVGCGLLCWMDVVS